MAISSGGWVVGVGAELASLILQLNLPTEENMGYQHINNLYKDQRILAFKEVYALEKIHGSSAHVSWRVTDNTEAINLFAGGESHERFKALFDLEGLYAKFRALGHPSVVVHGEVYGGKCQGMKDVYGIELKFVAFDVLIGDSWLDVPNAVEVVNALGLEFVDWVKLPTDIALLDAERDRESVQAIRNGMGCGHIREGIVLRPPFEVTLNNGERVIAKHKGDKFAERTNTPKVSPEKLSVVTEANKIAEIWVTEMRLSHVLDKLSPKATELSDIPRVNTAMLEDVIREAAGEIVDNKDVRRAITQASGRLFKARVTRIG